METNTKNKRNKIIASVVIILLLAIGAGALYIHGRQPLKGQSGATAIAAAPVAPVIPPAPAVTPADTALTTLPPSPVPAKSAPLAYAPSMHRHRHLKNGEVPAADLNTDKPQAYEGNPQPSPLTPEAETEVNPSLPQEQPKATVAVKKEETKNASFGRRYGQVNIAPEIGCNMNGLSHNNSSDLLTMGFHLGAMVNIRLNDDFALQPGLRYIMKGNEIKSTVYTLGILQRYTTGQMMLHYLELPVNLVYKFGDRLGYPRFMVGAGPYISYLLHAQNKISSTFPSGDEDVTGTQSYIANTTSSMKKLDYGIGGFLGCQMPKGFYASAGTEWGFRDLDKDPVTGNAADRNYNFMISLGYIIGHQGKDY